MDVMTRQGKERNQHAAAIGWLLKRHNLRLKTGRVAQCECGWVKYVDWASTDDLLYEAWGEHLEQLGVCLDGWG